MPFLKNLPEAIRHIKNNLFKKSGCTSLNLYAYDEARFGLLSIQRRCLTAKGIKPITPYQHKFKNFYLYGGYSPIDGDQYTLEFPYCNSTCFEQYLVELSGHRPDEFKILLLDNGAFHKVKSLVVPQNICLFFIPPYSPELNPAERIWRHIKDQLANVVFDNLEKLSDKVCLLIKSLTPDVVQSITGWSLYNKCTI